MCLQVEDKMSFYSGKNVLITGAAGITGQSAIKRLLDEGAFIRASVFNKKKLTISHKNLEVVHYDLMDYQQCQEVIKDIDICLNFASFNKGARGHSDPNNYLDYVRFNLNLCINMFDVAVRAKIDRFGFVGSSTMYPDVSYPVKEEEAYESKPHESYRGVGWLKRYCEQVIEYYQSISDVKFAITRTSSIYGPHDSFDENGHVIPMLIKKAESKMNPFEIWGDGTQMRDFIYADDVVDGLLTVLEKSPNARAYNIAAGEGTSVIDLVKMITEKYGYEPQLNFDLSKPVMIPTRLIDTSRAKNELNWHPKHTLSEGLSKTIDWYNDNKELYSNELN